MKRKEKIINKIAKVLLTVLCCLVFVVPTLSSPALAEVKKEADHVVLTPVPDTPLSYDAATQIITIAGVCNTDEIYAYTHEGGEAVNAITLRFAASSVIETRQYNPSGGAQPDQTKGPFANTGLHTIVADADA